MPVATWNNRYGLTIFGDLLDTAMSNVKEFLKNFLETFLIEYQFPGAVMWEGCLSNLKTV